MLALRSILFYKTTRLNELITIQSAGILDPEASKTTSPTTRSQIETLWVCPNLPLITGTVSCLSKP